MLHPLFSAGLHFIPFFLLRRVECRADLRVAGLMDVHHLRAAILLRGRTILSQAVHLSALRLEKILHLGLLVVGELEMFG